MNIIIFGPQGSGKGTQAKLISEKLGLFYFESGEFLRNLAESNPRIDEIINKKGELLPDEEIFSYATEYLEKNDPDGKNIIFDGYPRSVKQYELLTKWLETKDSRVDKAILLNISEEVSVKRLSARRICTKCGNVYNLITNLPPKGVCECGGELVQREDDKPEAIKKRLDLYKKNTKPLIEIFKKDGLLVEINGERPINTIFEDIIGNIT